VRVLRKHTECRAPQYAASSRSKPGETNRAPAIAIVPQWSGRSQLGHSTSAATAPLVVAGVAKQASGWWGIRAVKAGVRALARDALVAA
jgi:hypothetical protein